MERYEKNQPFTQLSTKNMIYLIGTQIEKDLEGRKICERLSDDRHSILHFLQIIIDNL
jgi:hypothetical protein